MPYRVTPESKEQAFLLVQVWGTLTSDEAEAASAEVLPLLHRWGKLLVDAEDLDNSAEALTMFMRSPARSAVPAGMRQAAVIGSRAAAPARTWVRLMSPEAAGIQVFLDRTLAVTWLLDTYDTTSAGS